jgi:serine/threonine protein kinase
MPDDFDPTADATLKLLIAGQRVFGRYVLERVLGRGGMGVVWKAHDDALDKDVALKFILEAYAQSPEAVAGLKRETRRCQELRHAGIVAIYDLQQENGRVAVSMEYVEGATLSALKAARANGCFDPAEVLPWIEQLVEALNYAHGEARVVHRDLKPSNLILTNAGRLKVMDFGIAQQLSETMSGLPGSRSGGVTPPYGSPQQLMGERARVADDVYSLGATIYDLLTGRPPFFRGQIDLQVLEVVPPPMAERRQELEHQGAPIPRGWETVIASCLNKSPDDRPGSVSEVLLALRDGWENTATAAPVVTIRVPRVEPVAVTMAPPVERHAPAPAPPPRAPEMPREETTVPPRRVTPQSRGNRNPVAAGWGRSAIVVLGASVLTAAAIHYARHLTDHPVAVPPPVAVAATPAPATPRGPLALPPLQTTKPPAGKPAQR